MSEPRMVIAARLQRERLLVALPDPCGFCGAAPGEWCRTRSKRHEPNRIGVHAPLHKGRNIKEVPRGP